MKAFLSILLCVLGLSAHAATSVTPTLPRPGTLTTNNLGSSTNASGTVAFTNILWCRTHFVDEANGRDPGIRGDLSKPYLSISSAVWHAQSGDTVLLRPGTYPVSTLSGGWNTNAPLKIWEKRDLVIAGMGESTIQAGGLGSIFSCGFFTNVIFRDLIIEGVRTNGQVADRYGVIWCRGPNKGLKLERVTMRNHSNQGVDTDPYPSVGWITEDITIQNCRFEYIGSTNGVPGLQNDGSPIDLGAIGRGVKIKDNWFLEGLRAIEFYQQDSGPMWLEDVLIEGNTMVGQIHQGIGIGSTNARNIKVINNTIVQWPTNATAPALGRYAIEFVGGKGMLFQGNSITGAQFGIVYNTQAQGDVDGVTIAGNTFSTISGSALYMLRATASGPAPKRVAIVDNLFVNVASIGIYGQCTDSLIEGNTFLDAGQDGTSPIYFGMNGGASLCTNTVIRNNLIQKSGAIAYGAASIELGASAYDTQLIDNRIGIGVSAIVNNGTSTKGLLGVGWNDYLGGAGVGSVWSKTNVNGMGTFATSVNLNSIEMDIGETTYHLTGGGSDGNSLIISNVSQGTIAEYDGGDLAWRSKADLFVDGITVSNQVARVVSLLAGVGGANTNFTLTAEGPNRVINGFTNVSIRAVMGTVAGLCHEWTLLITNGSGTSRTLEFSAVTNRWRFQGTYGTNAPNTLTNNTQIQIEGRSYGTNTLVTYDYFAWP